MNDALREKVALTREVKHNLINKLLKEVVEEPPEEFNDRKDLIYWSFLETVRQIASISKDHAIFLVRIWHSFTAHQTNSVQMKID